MCLQQLPNGGSIQNGMPNGVASNLNGLNAAALALQALAAANPALLLSQNPWLAQHMQQQLLNGMGPGQATNGNHLSQFGANVHAQQQGSMPGMEAAQFAQHLAAGQHLNGAAGEYELSLLLMVCMHHAAHNRVQFTALLGFPSVAAHVGPC